MKVRHKEKGLLGFSNNFNTHSLDEIIIRFDDINGENMGADSDYIYNYESFLEATQKWKDMRHAFQDHDLITDNYNTYFFESKNEEDRIRGFAL